MAWLGFALAVCYAPGLTGASIPTQWALLSLVLPVLMFFRTCEMTAAHWLGLAFASYSVLSMAWSVNPYDGVYGLWMIMIWGLSFWLGSTIPNLADLWKGLAIGLAVNSAVAILQWWGYHPVELASYPAGLLFTPFASSSAAALTIVALVCHRAWFYIPGTLPLLALSGERAGYAVVVIGVMAKYLGALPALTFAVCAAFLVIYHPTQGDLIRLQIWQAAWHNFTWLGLGPGSFIDLWMSLSGDNFIHHPEHAHNDYIEAAFEAGLGALALFGLAGWTLARTDATDWPVFFAFAALAAVAWPLHSPISAFIGCVAAGRIAAHWRLALAFEHNCRSHLLAGSTAGGLFFDQHRDKIVPVAPRPQNEGR